MGSVLSTRYSDKDLEIFKKLILGKIEKAKHSNRLGVVAAKSSNQSSRRGILSA